MSVGGLHHVEVWVPDLGRAEASWGWLLGELGWQPHQHWRAGRSWRLDATYLVLEESPALSARTHDGSGFEVELVAADPGRPDRAGPAG